MSVGVMRRAVVWGSIGNEIGMGGISDQDPDFLTNYQNHSILIIMTCLGAIVGVGSSEA
jgi:hypothetical protein